jgi:hypothetical protein
MNYLKSFNEAKIDFDLYDEIFQYVKDISLDFEDLGLYYTISERPLPGSLSTYNLRYPLSVKKVVLHKSIKLEITDSTYRLFRTIDEFNSIVKRIKDYVEDQGCNFFVSRFDEHDNYLFDDTGYIKFEDYLSSLTKPRLKIKSFQNRNPGIFYGFEITIF